MRDIIITILVTLAVAFGVGFSVNYPFGILMGIIAGLVTFLILSKKAMKQLEIVQAKANKAINSRNIERAVKIYEGALSLSKKSPFVKGQIYGMIGMLHFVTDNKEKAIPALEKSSSLNWVAKGMLGVVFFKEKKYEEVDKIMKKVVAASKKEGLAWGLYAYLLSKQKRYDEAIAILEEGNKKLNDKDERLKANIVELKNGRKMKMKLFGDPWYQFRLEEPPKRRVQQESPGYMKFKKNAHYRGR
ncbi:MAG: hypothetical protein CR982_06055 [Candidatus Cloacimonadota bacterium]|nr:MAG: hypothetical protein CR982_06055 [Candidatus Cloacimonadota bacterium]PIE78083.1 MAG: hypothetical protein CSA15_09615 [Candidatus Delongbacteria bacterium]